jgi:hypothetical protein
VNAAALVVTATVVAVAGRAIALRRYAWWFAHDLMGDASVHFTIIRHLRGAPRSRHIEQYLIAGEPMSYPTGFHRIAALLPLSLLRRHPWLVNAALWTVAAALFAQYAWHLEGSRRGPGLPGAWVAVAVLLVSPSALVFRGPSIAYLGLSERLLGRLSCAACFALLVGAAQFGDTADLPLAGAAAAVAILSSVFARQALLFTLPLLAVVWWDVRPLAVLVAASALAFAASPRHLYDSMRHTVEQWRIYSRRVKVNPSHRATLSALITPQAVWRSRHHRHPRRLARAVLRLEPTRSMVLLPEILLAVALAAASPGHALLTRGWFGPLLATAAVYLFTATERGNHLGEAHRYLEYNLLFAVPLLAGVAARSLSTTGGAVALAGYALWVAAAVVLFWVVVPRHERPFTGSRLNAFLEKLDLPHGAVVFPVPMYLAADICARRADCRSFWWQPGYADDAIYDEFFEEYPFLKREYAGLFARYGVTHVVCDETQLRDITWRYDFSELQPLHCDGVFSAYAVSQRALGTRTATAGGAAARP